MFRFLLLYFCYYILTEIVEYQKQRVEGVDINGGEESSLAFELSKQEPYVRVEAPLWESGMFLIGDMSITSSHLVKKIKLANIIMILGNIENTIEVQAIKSFYILRYLRQFYETIQMLVPILILIFRIKIGVLVIVWLEREIFASIQQHILHEYVDPLGILHTLAFGIKLL
ncbi:LOW QUALITY PROTEIN: hypothetical protein Cgig2_008418 [Carnegiea gigantea]|uniref:Uncharacterized protein n=1 Tax=Carnegiea gigantea TaxID=171969 RepID=A0A9Q1K347_9CARY|nr:LOW QUALITY PROTEIN: hypothetical protein Cgig2_008418 [Carnegiea gigantea]